MIILSMGSDKPDENDPAFVMNMHNKPIVPPQNIEDHPIPR